MDEIPLMPLYAVKAGNTRPFVLNTKKM